MMQRFARNHWVALATALVMAASFGPSFAHVLEAPPRLLIWSPELWREATVFNAQFRFFAVVGAPLDVGAIVFGALFAWLVRRDRAAFPFALVAALLYAVSLATWFGVVAPANAVLATWQPGPVPGDFAVTRDRWEIGHMIVATVKLCGLVSMLAAMLRMDRCRD